MTRVEDLDTPALVVDLDIMDSNLRRVADYCAEHRLRLRPHTKTHKSIALARLQLALGACGLTVAKTGEAEVMLGAEPRDLLVAFPVVGAAKLRRLTAIAGVTRVSISVDSLAVAKSLSEAAQTAGVRFGILVEIDVGLGRVGVLPGQSVELSRAVAALPGLDLRGIAFYPGHIKDQNEAKLKELSGTVSGVCHELAAAGIAPEIVSGGSTPALFHSHQIEGMNEIRPGTYVFNDLNTVASGACALEECAASVLVTVVSTSKAGQMIVDGGSKTFSSDRLSSGAAGYGRVTEAPGAAFHRMNEEHGFIDVERAGRSFQIGEKIRVIPNHVCVAVNLHEFVFGVRRGVVEEVWNVEGRGKLQ